MLESNLCPNFEDLIPVIPRPVQQSIQAGYEEDARAAIELLIEVAETEPKFWNASLQVICPLMMSIASNTQLEDDDSARGTRQMVLEVLVAVSEKLPIQCRKMGNLVQSVFPIGLCMMRELEDDPSWNDREDEDYFADQYNYEAGREILDRIAIALGGKAVLPVSKAVIPPFYYILLTKIGSTVMQPSSPSVILEMTASAR
jgi:importin-5